MKLYIVGSVASGKTTLANQISALTSIPCTHLDELVHTPDPAAKPWGNRKRPDEDVHRDFARILACPDYILEDTGRPRFEQGMAQADTILLLDPPLRTIRRRILRRWLRQNLGVEPCIYRPTFYMLRCMFEWADDFAQGRDGCKDRLAKYSDKVVRLRNNKEINQFLALLR